MQLQTPTRPDHKAIADSIIKKIRSPGEIDVTELHKLVDKLKEKLPETPRAARVSAKLHVETPHIIKPLLLEDTEHPLQPTTDSQEITRNALLADIALLNMMMALDKKDTLRYIKLNPPEELPPYRLEEALTVDVAIPGGKVLNVVVNAIDTSFVATSIKFEYTEEEMRLFADEMLDRIQNKNTEIFIVKSEEEAETILAKKVSDNHFQSFPYRGGFADAYDSSPYDDFTYNNILIFAIYGETSWKILKCDLDKITSEEERFGITLETPQSSVEAVASLEKNLDPSTTHKYENFTTTELQITQAIRAIKRNNGITGLSSIDPDKFEDFKKNVEELPIDHSRFDDDKAYSGFTRLLSGAGDKRAKYVGKDGKNKVSTKQFSIKEAGEFHNKTLSGLHFIDSPDDDKIFSGDLRGEIICDSNNLTFENCTFTDVDFTKLAAPRRREEDTDISDEERSDDTIGILRGYKFINCTFEENCKFPKDYIKHESIFCLKDQFQECTVLHDPILAEILGQKTPIPKPVASVATRMGGVANSL